MRRESLYPLEQEFSLELPLGYSAPARVPSVAVVLHAFHVELLHEFRAYLDNIPFRADLFVSTDTEAKQVAVLACFANWAPGMVETRVVPNRGRDVAPKVVGFASVHDRYEYVLHLHTKQSPHDSRLVGWRGYLLDTLLGSPETVRGVFEVFARMPRLGMLAPQHIDELRPWIRWGQNHREAEALAGRMGFALPPRAPLDFPSGSMFWARSAALRPLLDLGLAARDFPEERGQTDGTLAHCIERLYFHICEQAGYDWMKLTARGELHEQGHVTAVPSSEALDRFLSRRLVRLSESRGVIRAVEDNPLITSPPPRPRRVLHVLWRQPLGDAIAPGRRLAIVLRGEAGGSGPLARSVEMALLGLPPGADGERIRMPARGGSPASDTSDRNLALRAGFDAGADLVLLLDAPGLLHPGSGAALLRMSDAHGGRALMQVETVPNTAPRRVGLEDFSIEWAGGPGVAIPRTLFKATGGFDERLDAWLADIDLSWRARALGLSVLQCPRALFSAGVGAAPAPELKPAAGLLLASKWGDAPAVAHFTALLRGVGAPDAPELPAVREAWRRTDVLDCLRLQAGIA